MELDKAQGQAVRMEWLRLRFLRVTDGQSEAKNGYAARGYLLYILGCTLFTDKTCTRAPICFLALLWDLNKVHIYVWGAGALVYLYRQLEIASWIEVKQLAGYVTLLEGWIYEHFRPLEPHRFMEYRDEQPCMQRWTPRKERGP